MSDIEAPLVLVVAIFQLPHFVLRFFPPLPFHLPNAYYVFFSFVHTNLVHPHLEPELLSDLLDRALQLL